MERQPFKARGPPALTSLLGHLVSSVAEELVCRGFLFDYLRLHVASVTSVELVLITSAIFGVAHLYQGWRGMLVTGVAGGLLAVLYLATGTLVAPMLVHAAGNPRIVPIFWPGRRQAQTPLTADSRACYNP